MEQKLSLIAKKAWSLMHAIFYMLKKGISKVKIMVDLNMMIKHGKIAGKSLHNRLFHHHHNWAATIFHRHPHHLTYPPPPPPADEYEFSCTTTPDHFPLSLLSTNKKHNEQVPHAVIKELKMLTYASPGFEKSPMVRQLRITDSPFPLSNGDEDGQVDADADEYITSVWHRKSKLNGNKQVTSNGQNKPQFVPKTDAHVESGNINFTPQQFEQLLRSMQPIRTDVDAEYGFCHQFEVGITCLNSQLDELELLEDWI
ncbi:hypothetical protein Tco_1174385 [Tanacetum coccineum]